MWRRFRLQLSRIIPDTPQNKFPSGSRTVLAAGRCKPAHQARLERSGPAGIELKALIVAVVSGAVFRPIGEMHLAVTVDETAAAIRRVTDATAPAAILYPQAFFPPTLTANYRAPPLAPWI